MNSELMSRIVITVKKQYVTRNHNSDEQWTHVSYCNFCIVISYCIVASIGEKGALLYHINYKISEI